MSDFLQFALNYASKRHWHIFPLSPDEKTPIPGSRGLLDATNDKTLIETYWTIESQCNIGIRTGKESGLIVLDIDIYKPDCRFGELIAKYGTPPDTLTARTGKDGTHYYFRYPADNADYGNKANLAGYQGIDVRANGGYVVAPPSLVNTKPYRWEHVRPVAPCPTWLLSLIQKDSTPISSPTIRPMNSPHEFYADCLNHLKQRAIPYLVSASKHPAISGQGGDNATYSLAGNLASLDCDGVRLGESDILEFMFESPWNASCIPPWGKRELSEKIRSALKNGTARPIKPCELCPHRKKYAHILNQFNGGAK